MQRSSALTRAGLQPSDALPDDEEAGVARVGGVPRPSVRVMHVVYRLQPGGMELGVVKLVNGLDPAVVHSSICSTVPASGLRELVSPDVPIFELRRRDGNDPRLIWELLELFRRERPDIVHTHGWGTLVEGWSAARLARVPIVVHGEHGTLQLNRVQRRVQRFVWARADRLLSVSSRLADRMSAATGFPRDRITVVTNGVDLSRFTSVSRTDARRALDIPDDVVVIGTAGRLVPVKNQSLLLEALGALSRQGVPFMGLIAGEGPLRDDLTAKATALGLGSRIRFLGHRPDPETVYAALDLFVLSSHSEGMSNTILEAMASGVAVVATRVGGADELVADGVTGVLVPPSSKEQLAVALLALATDESRRRSMGMAGRDRAGSVFGLSRMIREYESVYREVVERPSAERART